MACVEQIGMGNLRERSPKRYPARLWSCICVHCIELRCDVSNSPQALMSIYELTELCRCLGGEFRTWKDNVVYGLGDSKLWPGPLPVWGLWWDSIVLGQLRSRIARQDTRKHRGSGRQSSPGEGEGDQEKDTCAPGPPFILTMLCPEPPASG